MYIVLLELNMYIVLSYFPIVRGGERDNMGIKYLLRSLFFPFSSPFENCLEGLRWARVSTNHTRCEVEQRGERDGMHNGSTHSGHRESRGAVEATGAGARVHRDAGARTVTQTIQARQEWTSCARPSGRHCVLLAVSIPKDGVRMARCQKASVQHPVST